MDEIRAALWEGIRAVWPPTASAFEVDQHPVSGNLLVRVKLPSGAYARGVSVRFDEAVIAEMKAADGFRRAEIVGRATGVARRLMYAYDPLTGHPDSFILMIGHEALDN